MTKKTYILATLTIIALALQVYLTKQFYSVQYGVGLGESVCNINELFNCDSVALSKYSKIFGVPNAVLGIFLNLVLLIGLLGFLFNSNSDEDDGPNWLNFFYTTSVISLVVSLILAGVSFFVIKKICIFCATLYVISILSVVLTKVFFKTAKLSLPNLVTNKVFLGLLVCVPVLGFITHKVIKNEYSPKKFEREINMAISQWQSNPELIKQSGQLPAAPLFVQNKGGDVKIIEFADFLCPHCATAHKSLSTFLKTYTNVEFSFYAYPLDASCNSAMDKRYAGPGFTCTLAKGVFCAGKLFNKGKDLHHEIYDNQRDYGLTAQKENNSGLIKKMASFLEVPENDFEACVTSNEAQDALLSSSEMGKEARISGTPTVFMNGKKLPGGSNFLMLKRALESQ